MNQDLYSLLHCPDHQVPLERDPAGSALLCPHGCSFPLRGGVPRFVPGDDYAASFGLQWQTFAHTQLDSHTHTHISRDRLARCLGGSTKVVAGKLVLEAGCGAGRFSEVLIDAGAQVIACDLSVAVEANQANNGGRQGIVVCQADLRKLPVAPASAEVVICLGVVQHTPDPEETIARLCSYVRPGGMLVLDHYAPGYGVTPSRRLLRARLTKMSPERALSASLAITRALWPLHNFLFRHRGRRGIAGLRRRFLKLSPVVDYHDAYPELGAEGLKQWALLDTHDTLTDTFKHLRDAEQIRAALKSCGMIDIHTAYAGNGVEARASKPPSGESA